MDLEKAYDGVDWLALWEILRIYGVGGKLLGAIKSFHEAASACVKINGETSEHFYIKVDLTRSVRDLRNAHLRKRENIALCSYILIHKFQC